MKAGRILGKGAKVGLKVAFLGAVIVGTEALNAVGYMLALIDR